jgi:hypothetical protein
MAITKQTAKRSTGGKAPRTEIAQRAARNPRVSRSSLCEEWDAHNWIMFTAGQQKQWMAQPYDENLPPVSFADGDREIPSHVESWCRGNPGVALDSSRCERWGLTAESADENSESQEDDDEEEEEKDDDDEVAPASRSAIKSDLVVKSIKYESNTNTYKGCTDDGRWFALIFRMLRVNDDTSENMKQLRKFDEWCTENPNKAMQLPVGWRSATSSSKVEHTDIPILYRSTGMNCVPMAAANAIGRSDSRTAVQVSSCEVGFKSLRQFAAWFNENTLWRTVDVFRLLEDISALRPSPKSVMESILSCERGVYVVQPIDADGNSSHAVAVNCFNRTVHDCAEEFAMFLSIDSLSVCCGNGNRCVGFLSAYMFEMKPKKRSRNHRNNK